MSLTKVSYAMIQGAPVNVLDYGADPTGNDDSAAAIQAAIDAATAMTPPGYVVLSGNLKVADQVDVTCNIDGSNALVNIYTGGSFVISTEYIYVKNLSIELQQKMATSIIKVTVAHVTLDNPSIVSNIDDSPTHIAIDLQPPNTNGLWDVTVQSPYIKECDVGIQIKTTSGGAEGWITDVNVFQATIISFYSFGIILNDLAQKGIGYATLDNLTFENIAVASLAKTAIYIEGACTGLYINDVKDFNDDALLGTYQTIYATDPVLNGYIASGSSATLANYIMFFTMNTISNVRAEGAIALGNLQNLYNIDNCSISNKYGITQYNGFDYNFNFGQTTTSYEVDLKNVTVTAGTPLNITTYKNAYDLIVYINATQAFEITQVLPNYIVQSANALGAITVAFTTNIISTVSPNTVTFTINTAGGTPVTFIQPSANARSDNKLIVMTVPLPTPLLTSTDYISIAATGQTGDTIIVSNIKVYGGYKNPVVDMTPYLSYI